MTERFGRWYVLLTEPQREKTAAAGLIAHRVDVYLPELPHRKLCGRKMRTTLMPMMPGYLLARLVPDLEPWHRIRATPGIRAGHPALMCDGRYATIPDAAVQVIQAKEARLCERPCERPGALKIGDKIEAIAGPFAWLHGKIDDLSRLDSHGRVKAAFMIFGQLTKVEMNVSEIRAA